MGARPRRAMVIVGASAAAHVAVLTLLALHAPRLQVPAEEPALPHAVIPILLLPRLPPPVPGQATPGPIRLHRRPQRLAAEAPPVAPLQVPKRALETPPAPAPAPPRPTPPPAVSGEVRQVLRLGAVGCRHADLMRLSDAEREACEDQLAAGVRDAPFLAPGRTAARRAELQAEAARKDALVRRKEGPAQVGQGLTSPFAQAQDYDGEPYMSGAGVSLFGQPTHPPSKRAAKQLGRLPP